MASETELERMVVRIVGDVTSYQGALNAAKQATVRAQADIQAALKAGDPGLVGIRQEQFGRVQADVDRISGRIRALNSELANTQHALASLKWREDLTTSIEGTTKGMIALGAAVGAVGIKSAGAFNEFELEMSRIEGLVGVSKQQVAAWGEDILKLGPQMGKTPLELAKGLYFLSSSGLQGKVAFDALKESAKASAAGLGETRVVADAVSSAVNAYYKQGLTAAKATDILTATVREGKLEANQLAHVIGRLTPLASAMEVDFEDVAGTLAVMSRTGSNAAEASTALRAILSTLVKPAKSARAELEAAGISFADLRNMAKGPGGLIKVMTHLQERFKGNDEALQRIFPNIRASGGILNILAQNGKTVDDVMKGVRNSTGDTNKAFAVTAATGAFKLQQASSQLRVGLIGIGKIAAQTVVPAMTLVASVAKRATDWFNSLSAETKTVIGVVASGIVVLGGFLAAIMAAKMAFGMLGGGALIRTMLTPLVSVGGLLGVITGSVKLLFTVFMTLINPLAMIKLAIASIGAILGIIFSPLGLIVAIIALVTAGTYKWVQSVGGVAKAWEAVKAAALAAWEWTGPIREVLAELWADISEAGSAAFSALGDFAISIWEAITGSADINWQSVREYIVDAIQYASYTIKNFGQVAEFVWTDIVYGFTKMSNQIIYFFDTVIPALLVWFKDNWKDIFVTAFNFTAAVIGNLSSNIVNIMSNIPDLVRGKVSFSELWTPLTEGFENTIKKMPEIPARVAGEVETQLKDMRDGMAADINQGFAAFKEQRAAEREVKKWGAEMASMGPKMEESTDQSIKNVGKNISSNVGAPIKKATQEIQKFDAALVGSAEAASRVQAYHDLIRGGAGKLGTSSDTGLKKFDAAAVGSAEAAGRMGKSEEYLKRLVQLQEINNKKPPVVLEETGEPEDTM